MFISRIVYCHFTRLSAGAFVSFSLALAPVTIVVSLSLFPPPRRASYPCFPFPCFSRTFVRSPGSRRTRAPTLGRNDRVNISDSANSRTRLLRRRFRRHITGGWQRRPRVWCRSEDDSHGRRRYCRRIARGEIRVHSKREKRMEYATPPRCPATF